MANLGITLVTSTMWKVKGRGQWCIKDYKNKIRHHFRYKEFAVEFAKENDFPVKEVFRF